MFTVLLYFDQINAGWTGELLKHLSNVMIDTTLGWIIFFNVRKFQMKNLDSVCNDLYEHLTVTVYKANQWLLVLLES